jgi:hypothetical protein
MNFFITTDTAGARVGELVEELYSLESKVEDKYSNIDIKIGIVVRCLPNSYNRRSFTRYMNVENDLTIDFCVSLEEYKKLYKIEQRFELGKTFLEWLNKGLSNKKLLKNNSTFNKEDFLNDVIMWGKDESWFDDEVDYSKELKY